MDVEQKVEIAGSIIIRSRVFFDGWWLSAGVQGRSEHRPFWDQYCHYWRFNEHALLVSYTIHIAGLFESRSDTINLKQLWVSLRERADDLAREDVERLLVEARPTVKGVTILRSNVMAHRSAALEYNDVFKRAGLSPDSMRRLTEIALEIINRMRTLVGGHSIEFDQFALGDLKAIASLYQERIE